MNIQEIKVMLVTETKNQNNSIMMLLRNIISKYNVLEEQKGSKKIDVIEILNKEHKELNEELETCGWVRRITIQEQLNFLNQMLSQERMDVMAKFKDIIFEENVAIHCPEEWMANELLEYADSKGYKWTAKNRYTDCNYWSVEKQNTIYYISNGIFENIDYAIKNNHKILHYNDVSIKEGEEMETKLDYELWIKGRKARIGSKFFYNGEDEAVIVSINIRNEYGWTVTFDVNGTFIVMSESEIEETFFWEKPTLYQLPDTDGNLSEVKIGQSVWIKYEKGTVYEGVIDEFNGSNIEVMIICDNGKVFVSNKEGMTHSGGEATTNKPHRDFSDCMDWSHAPKEAIEWRVTIDGYAFWYSNAYCERSGLDYDYDCGMYYISAGYRADLLNENGVVEDWEYSLVKRPEGNND